jgi:hypothetical protein
MFDKGFFRVGGGRRWLLKAAVAALAGGLLAAPAQAAGPRRRLRARDLVLAPSGSELLLLPQTRPSVRVLNLTRTIPDTVDAADYLGELWSQINDTLAEGGRVFAQGLRAPVPGRLSAGWEQVGERHQVSPEQVRALLEHEFERRPAAWLGADVEELLPRKRPPPPSERPHPVR